MSSKLTAVLCIVIAGVVSIPYASAQVWVNSMDVLLDGDSARLVFDARYSNTYLELSAANLKVTEETNSVGALNIQHFKGGCVPVSVALVVNPVTYDSSFFDAVSQISMMLGAQIVNFHVLCGNAHTPSVVTYTGDSAQFYADMQAHFHAGDSYFADALNAAVDILLQDDTPYKALYVYTERPDSGSVSEYHPIFKTVMDYSIETYYYSCGYTNPFNDWLAEGLRTTNQYQYSHNYFASSMVSTANVIGRYAKANMVTFKRITENDGNVKTFQMSVTSGYGNTSKSVNIDTFDDSIQYKQQPVTVNVHIPNTIRAQKLKVAMEIADTNTVKKPYEYIYIYMRTIAGKTGTNTVTNDNYSITGVRAAEYGRHKNELHVRIKPSIVDTVARNVCVFYIDVTETVSVNEPLIEEIAIYSSDGRHKWNVYVQEYDASGMLQATIGQAMPLCRGDDLYIESEAGYSGYTWSNGDTGRVALMNTDGVISYMAYDWRGVLRCSDTLSVYFRDLPAPELNLENDTLICNNGSFRLRTKEDYFSYLWSTGSRAKSIPITQYGQFFVEVVDTYGCKGRSDTVSVQVNEAPDIPITFTPDSAVCEGEEIELRTYVLNADSLIWSTGDRGEVTTVREIGDYYVTVYIDECWYQSDIVPLNILPYPEPTIMGNVYACNNTRQVYTVTEPDPTHEYTWSAVGGIVLSGQGSPAAEILWLGDPIGTVKVRESNYHCYNTAFMDVALQSFAVPVVTCAGKPDICAGDTVRLFTQKEYEKYRWSTGDTTRMISVSEPGNYYVEIQEKNGCTGTSNPMRIRTYPLPDKPSIQVVNNALEAPDATWYRWYRNDTLLGAETGKLLPLRKNGTYVVEVGNQAGCSSYSDPYPVDFLGVDGPEVISEDTRIYPTVVRDALMVSSSARTVTVSLYTLLGQNVLHGQYDNTSGIVSVSVGALQRGLYLVRTLTGKNQSVQLIMKE